MLTYYEYAALSKTPFALADDPMLVFQLPADSLLTGCWSGMKKIPFGKHHHAEVSY